MVKVLRFCPLSSVHHTHTCRHTHPDATSISSSYEVALIGKYCEFFLVKDFHNICHLSRNVFGESWVVSRFRMSVCVTKHTSPLV